MGHVIEPDDVPRPYALLAELTHACPLRCVYCSNPIALTSRAEELTTAQWCSVLAEAASLGVLQAHLSGGEPLLRPDLDQIVAAAHAHGIYTQLVSSGIGLTADVLHALGVHGLDAVQLSVQAHDPISSDRIAGARAWAVKARAASVVVDQGLPLTLNVVLHRGNIDEVDAIVDLALAWHADRLELANVQFAGWAQVNRSVLLPTTAQTARALARFRDLRARLGTALPMVWVLADHHEQRPKACMHGWGRVSLTVAPDGRVLPCPAATSITSLRFDTVRERSLAEIWTRSPAFAAYRGEAWMPEPCRSCPQSGDDFGGCRCQAFALTGDASRTDPVCELSPDHGLVRAAVAAADATSTMWSLDAARPRAMTVTARRHGDRRPVRTPAAAPPAPSPR